MSIIQDKTQDSIFIITFTDACYNKNISLISQMLINSSCDEQYNNYINILEKLVNIEIIQLVNNNIININKRLRFSYINFINFFCKYATRDIILNITREEYQTSNMRWFGFIDNIFVKLCSIGNIESLREIYPKYTHYLSGYYIHIGLIDAICYEHSDILRYMLALRNVTCSYPLVNSLFAKLISINNIEYLKFFMNIISELDRLIYDWEIADSFEQAHWGNKTGNRTELMIYLYNLNPSNKYIKINRIFLESCTDTVYNPEIITLLFSRFNSEIANLIFDRYSNNLCKKLQTDNLQCNEVTSCNYYHMFNLLIELNPDFCKTQTYAIISQRIAQRIAQSISQSIKH